MKDLLSAFKNGVYEFKDPWRASDRSLTLVVPIVAKKKTARNYAVLEEVQDKVIIVDTGGIHGVQVDSNVDKPTFIRGGTMLKGATQERATQFGFVVLSGRSETVLVHCIHASRGINRGASFRSGGYAPFRVHSTMLEGKDQRNTWSEVSKYSLRMAQSSPSSTEQPSYPRLAIDDLMRTVEKIEGFRKDLTEILERIPDYVDQVGTMIIDPDGVLGLEMYDHPDSWKAFSKSIMRSFSEALTREDKTGIFKPDMEATLGLVQQFLEEMQRFREEEVLSRNKSRTVILRAKGYVGECTTLDGKTIHLLTTRTETAEPVATRMEPLLTRPEARQQSAMQRLVNWGKRKMGKGTQVIEALQEKPKTWTTLRSEVSMSKATLSSRLRELQESGAVERNKGQNGVVRYGLTGIGQEALHDLGQMRFQASGNRTFNLSDLKDSIARPFERGAEEACPQCHSTNVAVWGFSGEVTSYQCNDCRHKWARPRT